MASSEYKPVPHGCVDSSEDLLPSLHQRGFPSRGGFFAVVALLCCSLGFNAFWVYQSLHRRTEATPHVPTRYAGLVRDMPVPFTRSSVYTDENRTVQDAAWDAPEFGIETGLVALSDEYVRAKGLLPAQRWPWDDSKGIYIINGFHNLHCVQALRVTVLEAFDGKPLTFDLAHLSHCLNVVREEVMCNADDTPRYTGRINAEVGIKRPTSGVGENRMCNDWNQLRDWALEHSGCYKPINQDDPDFPTIERYKYCPDGRVLWP